MRSMMLGDCQHYASPYMRGVAQAMKLLGHSHAEVSVRADEAVIEGAVKDYRPDVLWTHMVLWPPPGSPGAARLEAICHAAARAGAKVVLHDGDAKAATRCPRDISAWCSLALVNHGFDRSAWKTPVLRWPYFAPVQKQIAVPVEALRCELFFAGTTGGGTYSARTALLEAIRAQGVGLRVPAAGDNTLARTAEIAASADAVLGFGRPGVPGWCDVRVFQYPGAGGILLHDDAQGHLEPWAHFVPYKSGDAASVVEALRRLNTMSPSDRVALRERAFLHVQEHHSSVARVRQVLGVLGVA